jgi:hypothetical protein
MKSARRRDSISIAALMLAEFAFAGCAVQGRPFERVPSPGRNAVIYVYRPYSYAGSLLRPAVTCNDDSARIGPGGYHAFVVAPGKVVCRVEGGETADEIEIHAEPEDYYVREEIGWGALTGHPHLDPVDTDAAQTEIQSCCVLENSAKSGT